MRLFLQLEKEEFSKIKQKPNIFIQHKVLWTIAFITFVSIFKLAVFFTYEAKNIRASDLTIQNILKGINEQRTLRNLQILNTDSRLSLAAQQKSDDMQKRHYFSHTDPEGNYIWNKIVEAGYTPYATLGENLAIEFYNTESLVQAWMNSPTHRQNVLNESFKDQGMGLNLGDVALGQYYSAITNTFGSLAKTSAPAVKTTTEKKPVKTNKAPVPSPTSTQAPLATASTALEITPSMALQPAGSAPSLNIRSNTQSLDAQSEITPLSENNLDPKTKTAPSSQVVGQSENIYSKNKKINIGLGLLLILLLLTDLKFLQKGKYPGLNKKLNNITLLFFAILLTALLYWL
jgi:uncharacterized protein YkwD